MKDKYWIFTDSDESFSWRSALACLCALIFGFASIGSLFGLEELPKSYYLIISGVFAFYFSKRLLQKEKKNENK